MSTPARPVPTQHDVPFLDVTDPAFDFGAPEVARARETNWYGQTPIGVLVLRYAEIQELLRDRRLVQNGRQHLENNGVTAGPVFDWFVPMILHRQGEDHLRLRRLVHQAFTPRVISRLRPFIRDTAERLAERIASVEVCDFVEMFADPLPVAVMNRLLGVPAEDAELFRSWSTDIGLVYHLAHDRDLVPRVAAAVTGLYGYVESLIDRRRAEPGDDLISALVRAQQAEEKISEEELRNLVVTLVFAAHDTTRHQLGHALATLCEHPDQWALLAERPELAEQAVDEVMRWCPSVPVIFRFATEDIDYHGLHIAAGTFVMLCVHAAHRDPRAFPAGDTFDIAATRDTGLLTFGAGAHYCLGAPTARAELAEALPVLARRLPPPRLAGPVAWRTPLGINGPERLPLRFG
jgi:cytochrome P450